MTQDDRFRLDLRGIDNATMIHVAGNVTAADVDDLDEAIGVLDAEAVIVISFLDSPHVDPHSVHVIQRYDTKRNGRLIFLVAEGSQPHAVIVGAGRSLQIAFSFRDAEHRADALSEAAHRAFSNDA